MIFDTVDKKLGEDPYAFGEPLKGEFKGYWRLRIGIYRVVYEIVREDVVVLVIKIGKRKDDLVYKELTPRLRKIRRH